MTAKDGGTAFPTTQRLMNHGFPDVAVRETEGGMTLRDWFAGMSLAGARACLGLHLNGGSEVLSELAYKDADAMLAERDKEADDDGA